jgi:uncharacterized LabA/DUF88 family protein
MGISSTFSQPYTGVKEVSYLFVDGNYFYNFLKDVFLKYFELENIPEINLNLLTFNFTKVFYYDTSPTKKNNQTDEQFEKLKKEKEIYFDKLREINGYHVYEGIARIRRKRQIQKGVDTMIAIDMLRHTFRKNMHEAALLAGDLDFLPLLEALVMEGMFTTLWYDSNSVSKDLLKASDSKRRLKIADIHKLLSKEDKERIPLPKMLTTKIDTSNDELIKSGKLNEKNIKLFGTDNSEFKMVYDLKGNGIGTRCLLKSESKLIDYIEQFYDAKIEWENE